MNRAEILHKHKKGALAENQRHFGINTIIYSNGFGMCLLSDPLVGEIQPNGCTNGYRRFKALDTVKVFSYYLKR
ncbi:MAG: hypothetical protein AAB876_02260, partial [Patescibacteria group bacterium]